MNKERRTLNSDLMQPRIEERAGKPPCITGYAAVYYNGHRSTEYELFPGAIERIMPGAFSGVLGGAPDVRGLFNHDPNYPLGRSAAGTLRLMADDKGLRYEIDPPDSEMGKTVMEALRRGDVSGSSFSFGLNKGDAEWRDMPDGSEIREIKSFSRLYDVGPVTFPAYEGTSAACRSEDAEQARKEFDEHQEQRRKEQQEARKQFVDRAKKLVGAA